MKNLYKIFFLLIAGPVVFLFAKPVKNSRWFRHLFIALHAVFLTWCTIFLFNRPAWRWADEKSLLKKISNTESSRAYRFIHDNFLLIDNSFDKMLLPNPDGDETDSTSLVLTNRKTLHSFLQLLNENANAVDLVVIDIGFSHPTPDDTAVKTEVLKLYADNKILLSINPKHTDAVRLVENAAAYGNISEKAKDNLFTSHTIYKDGYYSLPYKLYCILNHKTPGKLFFNRELFREKSDKGRRALALNTFFPEFKMANENILQGKNAVVNSSHPADMDKGTESSSRHYYYLSQPLSAAGRNEFSNNLRQRKEGGRKNIVFIGSFASPDEDVHQTLYGELHGATILLNVLYSLQHKDHVLRLGYLLFLLFGFWILSLVLFYHSLGIAFQWRKRLQRISPVFASRKKIQKAIQHSKAKKDDAAMAWLKNFAVFIYHFLFVKELPITLLVFFSALVLIFFGKWPNILPLLIYMAGVKISLDHAKKHILETDGTDEGKQRH